jgi:hypothetical protein
MALRYSCKNAQVSQGGTTFVHNLIGPLGTGAGPLYQAPDEWKANLVGPSPGAVGLYRVGAPTSTGIVWAASGATGSADIFCSINSTFVQ